MNKWNVFQAAISFPSGVGRPFAFAALCLAATSPTIADPQASPPTHASHVAQHEESVLVANREAAFADEPAHSQSTVTTDGELLEPIPQSSDFRPELASLTEQESSDTSFGDALTKGAKSHKKAPLAAKTADPAAADNPGSEPNPLPAPSSSASTGSARRAATANTD